MFSESKKQWLGILCFITTILYLLHVFFNVALLFNLYTILAGILLGLAIFTVRRSNQITATILVLVGTIIFLINKVESLDMIHAFGKNINLLTLFLVVPFIGVMISVGGYLTALKYKVREQEKKGSPHPYLFSSIINSTMGVILNLGSMPITYRISEESFSNFESKKMGIVLLRAFGFCMFWSPYFVNVGLVLVLFHVSWTKIGWVGISLGIVYLFLSAFFFRYIKLDNDSRSGKQEVEKENGKEKELYQGEKIERSFDATEIARKLRELGLWTLSLLVISFSLDYLLEVNMLTIVSLVALTFPLLWSLSIGIIREYIHSVVEVILQSFDRLKNEIVIFISAGYFGVSLSYTNLGDIISTQILHFSYGSIYVMSILIIMFTIFLAMIGVHPVIVIIGVGSSLSPALFGVNPEFLAVLLLLAWSLATMVSPFSGSVLMTAGLIKETPWTVAKQNIVFVLALVLVLPLFLYLMMKMGWV